MPTGAATKTLVVDCDPPNGGPRNRDELVERFGYVPNTAEQTTGGGGRHFVFQFSGGAVPKGLAPGVDLKADGGYIVLAPSLHPSGRRYKWDGIDGVKALLKPGNPPAWLVSHIQDIGTQRRSDESS